MIIQVSYKAWFFLKLPSLGHFHCSFSCLSEHKEGIKKFWKFVVSNCEMFGESGKVERWTESEQNEG